MYFAFLTTGQEPRRENLRVKALTGVAELALRTAYGAALRREYADLPLSRRDSEEYRRIRAERRGDLEAILLHGIAADNRERAADLICAICEESSWSEGAGLDDANHPGIDRAAADTGCLLGWAYGASGLDARCRARIVYEIRRRLLTPLTAHDDYGCFDPKTPGSLALLCDAMTAALLAEPDHTRLLRFLKRAARAAEAALEARRVQPLAEELAEQTAVTALWALARQLMGESALTRSLPKDEWLDALLLAHLGDGLCADPSGEGVTDKLNGADVYYLGHLAHDGALEALGAALYRKNAASSSCRTVRMTADSAMEMLACAKAVPRLRHAALPDGHWIMARGGGLALALYGGAKSAGAVVAQVEDAVVLLSLPGDGLILNGAAQNGEAGAGDYDFGETGADLRMDVTRCCPKEAGVRFAQRTAMLDRRTGEARIIDMAEVEAPGEAVMRFHSPFRPQNQDGALLLGPLLLRGDGGEWKVEAVSGQGAFPDGLYRVELRFSLEAGSNLLGCVLERA